MTSYKLPSAQHNQIYQKIESAHFAGVKPVQNPQVIITGGQPGSGKSRLISLSRSHFPDGNFVVINGDALRTYHPQAKEMKTLGDKSFAERTDADAREWTRQLLQSAVEKKLNIVFESTMREHGPIAKTMEKLKEEGYHITTKVVATHERNSTTGIYDRYESMIASEGHGRWTPEESHNAGYEGMPNTVEHIEKNGLADRMEVYDRYGEVIYENNYKDGAWERQAEAVEAIKAERDREPTAQEKQKFHEDWQRINDMMAQRNADAKEMQKARDVYEKWQREMTKDFERSQADARAEMREAQKAKPERERDDDLTR
jgi:predicted ABC-type ATPase